MFYNFEPMNDSPTLIFVFLPVELLEQGLFLWLTRISMHSNCTNCWGSTGQGTSYLDLSDVIFSTMRSCIYIELAHFLFLFLFFFNHMISVVVFRVKKILLNVGLRWNKHWIIYYNHWLLRTNNIG